MRPVIICRYGDPEEQPVHNSSNCTKTTEIEIRHLDQIRKYIIAVKAHQWIGVEQQRADPGNQYGMVGDQTGRRIHIYGPIDNRAPGREQLHEHTGYTHLDALPAVWKTPG